MLLKKLQVQNQMKKMIEKLEKLCKQTKVNLKIEFQQLQQNEQKYPSQKEQWWDQPLKKSSLLILIIRMKDLSFRIQWLDHLLFRCHPKLQLQLQENLNKILNLCLMDCHCRSKWLDNQSKCKNSKKIWWNKEQVYYKAIVNRSSNHLKWNL